MEVLSLVCCMMFQFVESDDYCGFVIFPFSIDRFTKIETRLEAWTEFKRANLSHEADRRFRIVASQPSSARFDMVPTVGGFSINKQVNSYHGVFYLKLASQ